MLQEACRRSPEMLGITMLSSTEESTSFFKGTGIFDLKRTQIYTHTFALSEVIDKI
jgi:hypothetical protein